MKIGVGFWFWVPKLVTANAALASWQVGRLPRFSRRLPTTWLTQCEKWEMRDLRVGWKCGRHSNPQKKMLKKLTKLWGQLYHPGNNSCSIFLGLSTTKEAIWPLQCFTRTPYVRSRWASIASISRWNVWEPRDGQQPMVRWIWGHGNAPNPKV